MTDRIYLSPPHMSGEEAKLVTEAFASNFIAPAGPALAWRERATSGASFVPALGQQPRKRDAQVGLGRTVVLPSDLNRAE